MGGGTEGARGSSGQQKGWQRGTSPQKEVICVHSLNLHLSINKKKDLVNERRVQSSD
jgi:hypothetical protein